MQYAFISYIFVLVHNIYFSFIYKNHSFTTFFILLTVNIFFLNNVERNCQRTVAVQHGCAATLPSPLFFSVCVCMCTPVRCSLISEWASRARGVFRELYTQCELYTTMSCIQLCTTHVYTCTTPRWVTVGRRLANRRSAHTHLRAARSK